MCVSSGIYYINFARSGFSGAAAVLQVAGLDQRHCLDMGVLVFMTTEINRVLQLHGLHEACSFLTNHRRFRRTVANENGHVLISPLATLSMAEVESSLGLHTLLACLHLLLLLICLVDVCVPSVSPPL